MATPYHYKVNVTLPIGEVTIEAQYYNGFPGSYFEPSDPPEIVVDTVMKDGQLFELTDDESELYYGIMLGAVCDAHEAHVSECYGEHAGSYLDVVEDF